MKNQQGYNNAKQKNWSNHIVPFFDYFLDRSNVKVKKASEVGHRVIDYFRYDIELLLED